MPFYHHTLSRCSVEKSSHLSANTATLVTSTWNDAVGNINSTEKFHQLAQQISEKTLATCQ